MGIRSLLSLIQINSSLLIVLLAFFLWSFHKLPHICILFGSYGSSKYLFWEKRIPLQPFQNSSFSLCGHILSITNLCFDRLFSALPFHSPSLSKKKKTIPRPTIFKLPKISDEEKILKAPGARVKMRTTCSVTSVMSDSL